MGDVFRILWAMNETRVTCSSEPQLCKLFVSVYEVAINHHILCKSKVYDTHALILTQIVQAYIHY